MFYSILVKYVFFLYMLLIALCRRKEHARAAAQEFLLDLKNGVLDL